MSGKQTIELQFGKRQIFNGALCSCKSIVFYVVLPAIRRKHFHIRIYHNKLNFFILLAFLKIEENLKIVYLC